MSRFIKLNSRGNPLPDSAESWSMVRDDDTWLTWEVKTDNGSIHDKDNKYTWADAQEFIAALNDDKFGGFSDWRLPDRKDLQSLADDTASNPAIDIAYFPNTMPSYYWSSTTGAHGTDLAWCIGFHGISRYARLKNAKQSAAPGYDGYKSDTHYVRAVRGGKP